ncbi:MAG: XRE family transcriptional regulator [Sphingobacteriaceae bacterium]|nr:XRE family transcriptional regulator [Sphingobacteriaceae bacterium]
MQTALSQKIAALRQAKGWSQELLAENAGINLRTLQRIENGHSSPRGDTLRRLSKSLETELEVLFDASLTHDLGTLRLLHLSVLSFPLVPLGNLIFPAIIWLTRRDKVKYLYEHGQNVLNAQLIVTLFWNGLLAATLYLRYVVAETTYSRYLLLFLFAIGLTNMVYPLLVSWMLPRKPQRLFYPKIRFL